MSFTRVAGLLHFSGKIRALAHECRELSPTARRLMSARFWRSLAQGALVVDLSLYLHALGWSGAAIGGVLSAAGFVGAGLNLGVGVTSDHYQRKPFLIAYEILTCACALTAITTTHPAMLFAAIVLAGFGRGANGAAGPFSPAEQAWLAEAVKPADRGLAYSLNIALGFIGMTLGALLATLPAFWRARLGEAGSYRPIFAIVFLGNAINLWLLLRTHEHRQRAPSPAPAGKPAALSPRRAGTFTRAQENRFLRQLIALNCLNGLAVGLTGPLIAYWFLIRFHVGPEFIAPVMALSFLLAALAAIITGALTRQSGLVSVVVRARTAGFVLLLLMPLMPLYVLAAALQILRSAFNRGTTGARQALIVSAIGDERRGLAVSLNALSAQIPMAVTPAIAGSLIGSGWVNLPFYIAAALQGLYVLFYGRIFGPQEKAILERENS